MGTYDDSGFDDLMDADLYHCSARGQFGRAPSRATNHMFRVLAWHVMNGQIVAEDPKYFGILHEWEAIQFGMSQAAKGLHVTVCKCPTLDAMDRRGGLKTTAVWQSQK
jgi:hypothetical protein